MKLRDYIKQSKYHRQGIQNSNRIKVLAVLEGGPLTRQEIAAKSGLHAQTVSRCLDAAKRSGLVKQGGAKFTWELV